jgi:integrase
MAVYPYQLADGSTRWYFIIDLPASTEGRRRQRKKRGFATETAAAKAEREALSAFRDVTLAADGSVTAELESWLQERELDVAETTVVNYRDIIRCYVTPHIGARQLYTVDKRALHDLYRLLEERGGRNGGPLSRTTVRTVHRVLMKALKDLGVALDGVRKPRPAQREATGRKGVWTPAQCAQFLDSCVEHRLRAAWVLAVVVGMRRGELAGLKWSKVDLDKGVLFVHWQRTATSAGVVEKEPKGKSKRAVAIGPAVMAELHAHQLRQDAEKAAAGVAYRDGGYVFCREDGLAYYPAYFTDRWADACEAADVPVIVLHDARHTSATTGADAGVPEHVMQRRLGHADSRTTREVYTHVLPDSERKAAEVMESVLRRDPAVVPAPRRPGRPSSRPARRGPSAGQPAPAPGRASRAGTGTR